MRYYTILLNGKEKIAVSANGRELYVMENVADINGLIAVGGTRELPKNAPVVSIGNVKLLSPIPRPGQDVLCLGINYTAHAEEAERFSKDSFGGNGRIPFSFPNGYVIPRERMRPFLPTQGWWIPWTTSASWVL